MSKHVIVVVRCNVFDDENNDNLAKWERDGLVFVTCHLWGQPCQMVEERAEESCLWVEFQSFGEEERQDCHLWER